MKNIDELKRETAEAKKQKRKTIKYIRTLSEYQEEVGDLIPPKRYRPKWYKRSKRLCPLCNSKDIEEQTAEGLFDMIWYAKCNSCTWEWASVSIPMCQD